MLHVFGEQHVDVEVQRADGRAHHFRQRMTVHVLHLAQHVGGAKHGCRSPGAEFAVDEFRQVVAQHEVDQKDGVGHLVTIFAHDGADFGFGWHLGLRCAGSARIVRFVRLAGNDAGRDKRTIPMCRIHVFRDGGERLQIRRSDAESRGGEQSHQRSAVGVIADYVQQGEDILYFRTFQQRRLADYQRGQSGLFQCILVFRHRLFGAEQHGHMRAIVFHAAGQCGVGWRV